MLTSRIYYLISVAEMHKQVDEIYFPDLFFAHMIENL